jgi:chromosome partitioning protein
MLQIFVANPKGGCGKTMLSIHLASYYAHRGKSVALCDHDPQQSSMDWIKTRPLNAPKISGVEFFNHNILTNRFDVAIHDMPAAFGC